MEDIKKKIKEAISGRAEGVYHLDISMDDLNDAIDEISVFIKCKFDKIYRSADRLWDSVTDIIDDCGAIDHLEGVCREELTDLNII